LVLISSFGSNEMAPVPGFQISRDPSRRNDLDSALPRVFPGLPSPIGDTLKRQMWSEPSNEDDGIR
jgi:hypothetical protein